VIKRTDPQKTSFTIHIQLNELNERIFKKDLKKFIHSRGRNMKIVFCGSPHSNPIKTPLLERRGTEK
jgi:hypothetical protein